MNNDLILYLILCSFLFVVACDDDDLTPNEGNSGYENGTLICNEGPFTSGTGTISFYNRESGEVENNVFQTVNSRPLGNIVQSTSTHNNQVYIVVNNANKIEVANSEDFTSIGVIEGLALPRYFLGIDDNKAYVSQWGSDGVTGSIGVLDLGSNTLGSNIATASGPERMLLHNNQVWVACSGGFGTANVVQVIDVATNSVLQSIEVADNPNSLQLDAEGDLWVLSSGNRVFNEDFTIDLENSTTGALQEINTQSFTVSHSFDFDQVAGASDLVVNSDGSTLYYLYNGDLRSQSTSSSTFDDTVLVPFAFYYGIGFDLAESVLYASDPIDYTGNGVVYKYNSDITAITDTLNVGIVPNGGFNFGNE